MNSSRSCSPGWIGRRSRISVTLDDNRRSRLFRHARESGHPGATDAAPEALGPRFRGGDGEEKIGLICLVRRRYVAKILCRVQLPQLPPRHSLNVRRQSPELRELDPDAKQANADIR